MKQNKSNDFPVPVKEFSVLSINIFDKTRIHLVISEGIIFCRIRNGFSRVETVFICGVFFF